MSKKAIKPGLRAAIECHPTCAIGADDRCEHCGAHFSEPHDPACPHADEPVDECETARADAETPADELDADQGDQGDADQAAPVGDPFWNCCAARPAGVVIFDNGARHAACAGCVATYERHNGPDMVGPLPDGYTVPADCPAALVNVEECDWEGHQSAIDEAGVCPVCQ